MNDLNKYIINIDNLNDMTNYINNLKENQSNFLFELIKL